MRNEVVSMPMIKVRCVGGPPGVEFASYVPVLPEVGDVMLDKEMTVMKNVKKRHFLVDGTVVLVLD